MSSNLILFILVSMITNINAQAVACTTQTPGTACILDCGGIDTCKQKTLICRAYDPCIIRCDAKATCSAGTTINAYAATDVTVICSGDNACKDEIVINCGTGHCELQCSHQFSTACENFGHIDTSYAASFMCVGRCPHNIPAPFSPNPTLTPTITPSQNPTQPSIPPTNHPSSPPSSDPTVDPTIEPTFYPTYNPTIEPTLENQEKKNYLTVNGVIITVTTIFGLCCVSICLLRLLYLNNKAKKDIEDKNDVNTEEISSNILSIKKQEKKEIDSIVSEIGNKESDDWKIQIISALAEVQFKISNATAKSHSGVGVGVDYNSSVTMQSRSQHSQHSLQSNGSQCDNSNGVNKVMMNGPPPPPPVVGAVSKLVEEISSSSDAPSAIESEMKGLIVENNDEVENGLIKNDNDNDEVESENMLIKNEVESNGKV